jgi:dolichol-phosphate mannosyltransferase
VNKGVGAAFCDGIKQAVELSSPEDIIVTLEGDNTSDLKILSQMVQCIEQGGSDLVLASCYAPGGSIRKTSLYRKVLSVVANRILQVLYPKLRVATYSSFYRAYRREMLARALTMWNPLLTEPGFVCMVELLIKLSSILPEGRIAEIPMVLDQSQRKGKSKMKIVRTIYSYLTLIVRLSIKPYLGRIFSRT